MMPTDDIHDSSAATEAAPTSLAPGTTANLIRRIRAGESAAREELFRRYLPLLQRWARGRLPAHSRDVADTDDLVQVTLMSALGRVEQFEPRYHGSFLSYLRQVFLNELRHEIRRSRRQERQPMPDDIVDEDLPTMLEQIVGAEQLRAYQSALGTLTKRQQEVLIMRIEFGMSYPEIALETGRSADAVRIMATRAAVELGRMLGAQHDQDQ